MISIKKDPPQSLWNHQGSQGTYQPHSPKVRGQRGWLCGATEDPHGGHFHTTCGAIQGGPFQGAVVSSGWQWMMAMDEVSWGWLVGWWVPVSLGGKKPEGYGSRIFFWGNGQFWACGFLFHMFFKTRSFVDSQVRLFLFYFLEEKCKKRYDNYEIGSVNCWMFERLLQYVYIYYDFIPSLQCKLRADFVRSALATRAQRWLLPAWPTWTRHPDERSYFQIYPCRILQNGFSKYRIEWFIRVWIRQVFDRHNELAGQSMCHCSFRVFAFPNSKRRPSSFNIPHLYSTPV